MFIICNLLKLYYFSNEKAYIALSLLFRQVFFKNFIPCLIKETLRKGSHKSIRFNNLTYKTLESFFIITSNVP